MPDAPGAGLVVFWVCFLASTLLGGWLSGQWIVAPLERDQFHAGYFLPSGDGGLLGGECAASFGPEELGWMSFAWG